MVCIDTRISAFDGGNFELRQLRSRRLSPASLPLDIHVQYCVGSAVRLRPNRPARAPRVTGSLPSILCYRINSRGGRHDEAGQLNLVDAAKRAGIERFVFVSFRRPQEISFPLGEAKEQVEGAIANLNFTVLQASWFMEVWLSPALGFDFANATARIYGPGTSPVSWVSFRDVAEMCAVALRSPAAERKVVGFGGPEALSPLEVVSRFETIGGRAFRLDYVSEADLLSQFEAATDPLQKSFAGLMLGYARGDAIDMVPVIETFGIGLTSVDEYARRVLRKAGAQSSASS